MKGARQIWQTLRRILPYLRPYRRLLVASLLFTLLATGINLLLPWPLALTFDSVLGDKPLPAPLAYLVGSLDRVALLIFLALAGLGLTAGQGVNQVLNEYYQTRLEQRMVLEMRSDMFQHAQRLSLAYHDRRHLGLFSAQINLQAQGAGQIVVAVPPLLEALLTLIGMLVIAFTIDVKLTLLALSVVPFVYYTTGYYAKRIQPRLIKVRGMEAESLAIVHEAMSMLRVIIPFGRESYEYGRFRNQAERAVDARVNLTVRQTLFSTAVNVITGIGTAIVLGYGAYRILQGHVSGGDLLVLITYVAKVYSPLQQVSTTVTHLQEQYVNLQGALQLLDEKPAVKDAPGAYKMGRASGHVRFEGVNFSYQGRVDTLRDVSFEARPGDRIAIVGPTGAGKTTLMNLLTRFYDPSGGRILLEGFDTRKITLKAWREQISLVLQEPLLFSGSLADNIRYGRLEASRDEVVEAAKAANVHDFIMHLPEKYETKLGEGGKQLSGGERQRISVARAFVKDAPILILDEPTSSIDSKTEAVILNSLERLMEGRTTFMIAHRLSTVRAADLILVMNHGRLVEQGTHDDLLRHGGLYQQLHAAQTGQAQPKEGLEQSGSLGHHRQDAGNGGRERRDSRTDRDAHEKPKDPVEHTTQATQGAKHVEVLEVSLSKLDHGRLWGRYLDYPKPQIRTEAHALQVVGWVLGKDSPATAAELVHEGRVLERVPLNHPRPDIAEAFPDVPGAENSGFRTTVSVSGAASKIVLQVQAVLQDESRVPLAEIHARRCRGEKEEERADAPSASADARRAENEAHRNGRREAELATQEQGRAHQSMGAPSDRVGPAQEPGASQQAGAASSAADTRILLESYLNLVEKQILSAANEASHARTIDAKFLPSEVRVRSIRKLKRVSGSTAHESKDVPFGKILAWIRKRRGK